MRDYDHDVFVSYSHCDKDWVMDTFVPRLRKDGLDVHTDAEFTIGEDARLNMAQAVARSRRTV